MKNKNILYIEDQTFFQEFIKNIIIARESKNFTQKQASSLLNININIIINLERGDLEKLENNVFVLGHIKTYLKWLNIEYQLFFQKINSKKRMKVSDVTFLGQGDRALILSLDNKDFLFISGKNSGALLTEVKKSGNLKTNNLEKVFEKRLMNETP